MNVFYHHFRQHYILMPFLTLALPSFCHSNATRPSDYHSVSKVDELSYILENWYNVILENWFTNFWRFL